MAEKEDIYLRLHREAREQFLNGEVGTVMKVEEIIKDEGLKGKMEPNFVFGQIYKTKAQISGEGMMSMDAYFRLLEYEELKEAREDSKQARKEALIAMGLAIIAIILQLATSLGWIG